MCVLDLLGELLTQFILLYQQKPFLMLRGDERPTEAIFNELITVSTSSPVVFILLAQQMFSAKGNGKERVFPKEKNTHLNEKKRCRNPGGKVLNR